jgi:hypothetical protein
MLVGVFDEKTGRGLRRAVVRIRQLRHDAKRRGRSCRGELREAGRDAVAPGSFTKEKADVV